MLSIFLKSPPFPNIYNEIISLCYFTLLFRSRKVCLENINYRGVYENNTSRGEKKRE